MTTEKKAFSRVLAVVLAFSLSFAVFSVFSGEAKAFAASSKPVISTIVKDSKGFTVKWKKSSTNPDCSYQIRYSVNKGMKTGVKTVNAANGATSKKVSQGVKPATTYYVQVREVVNSDDAVRYSNWSSSKCVTTMVGSKNASFDKKIESLLTKKIKKTGLTGLKRAFDYVAGLNQGASVYTGRSGAWTKWSVPYANAMASKGRGNCYQAAALFAWLAKGLGYEAKAVSGKYTGGNGKSHPHGWTEVKIGSKFYIFDANNQNTADKANLHLNYYKIAKSSSTGKKYKAA